MPVSVTAMIAPPAGKRDSDADRPRHRATDHGRKSDNTQLLSLAQDASLKEASMHDHEYLTVPEVAGLLRISRNLAYELLAQGELPSFRLGSRIRIPRDRLSNWLTSQQTGDDHE